MTVGAAESQRDGNVAHILRPSTYFALLYILCALLQPPSGDHPDVQGRKVLTETHFIVSRE